MQRRCPSCGSLDVRRSNVHDAEGPARTRLQSRYRCRSCRELFWVVSARAYRFVGIYLGLTLLVFAVVALMLAAIAD